MLPEDTHSNFSPMTRAHPAIAHAFRTQQLGVNLSDSPFPTVATCSVPVPTTSVVESICLPESTYLYRRSHPGRSTSLHILGTAHGDQSFSGSTWFAFTPAYGSNDTYGPIVTTYKVIKDSVLLNLGSMAAREMLRTAHPQLEVLLDPDEQYAGGSGNKKLHKQLRTLYDGEYAGTYINSDGPTHLHEDLDGPSEIVLWDLFAVLARVSC